MRSEERGERVVVPYDMALVILNEGGRAGRGLGAPSGMLNDTGMPGGGSAFPVGY